MKTKKIVVNTAKDIEELVANAGRVKGDIQIETEGNAKFDASSILGLFSVAPGSAMAVSYPDAAEDFEDFLATLEFDAVARGY